MLVCADEQSPHPSTADATCLVGCSDMRQKVPPSASPSAQQSFFFLWTRSCKTQEERPAEPFHTWSKVSAFNRSIITCKHM